MSADPSHAVTQLLDEIRNAVPGAPEALLPLVYDELQKLAAAHMANEKPGQTLQTTALVHEAYLRLVGGARPQNWDGRGHFFAAAAEAMRRILVERARARNTLKRGGGRTRRELNEFNEPATLPDENLIDLDDALTRLAAIDPVGARLVELRFFAGLTMTEAAAYLGLSVRTADRVWAQARAWLLDALGGE